MADKIEWGGTPGPWHEGHNVSHEPTVHAGPSVNGGFIVCQLFGSDAATNRRAIAKVPEMVAALRRVSAYHSNGPDNDALCDEYADACRACEISPTTAGLLNSVMSDVRAILAAILAED